MGKSFKAPIISAFAVTAFFLILRRDFTLAGICDATALSGICLFVAALFWTARSLHCYDLIIYGFQKFTNIWKNQNFTQSTSEGYAEFLAGRNYKRGYGSWYAAAVCLFLFSAFLCIWL